MSLRETWIPKVPNRLWIYSAGFTLQDGTTIVMVTHNPRVARRGDRCITLIDGQIENHNDTEAVDPCIS